MATMSETSTYPFSEHKKENNNNKKPNLWFLSGKLLATVVLVVLPTCLLLSQAALEEIKSVMIDGLRNHTLTVQYVNSQGSLYYNIITYFQYIAFIIILVVFPPFPAPFSTQKYFKTQGYENAVVEYEYVRKILLVSLYLLIIVLVFLISLPGVYSYFPAPLNRIFNPAIHQISSNGLEILPIDVIYLIRIYLFIIVFAAFLKMLFATGRSQFRLYFAKGCFEIIKLKKEDEVKKMSYLIKGLNSYNKYLKRLTKLQITDLVKIYSSISSCEDKTKISKTMESLSGAFEKGDTLEPLRKLSSMYKIPRETLLTEQPLIHKIKELNTLIIPMATIVITLITAFLPKLIVGH